MGLGVQGATGNVSSSNRNVNAETGPLATNTLAGLSQSMQDGVNGAVVPLHFQKQVTEAQAAAVGAADTVANPVAANGGVIAPRIVAPQMAEAQQVATLPAVIAGAPATTAFCTSCGAQLVSGAKFCAACGTPCGAASQPAADMV